MLGDVVSVSWHNLFQHQTRFQIVKDQSLTNRLISSNLSPGTELVKKTRLGVLSWGKRIGLSEQADNRIMLISFTYIKGKSGILVTLSPLDKANMVFIKMNKWIEDINNISNHKLPNEKYYMEVQKVIPFTCVALGKFDTDTGLNLNSSMCCLWAYLASNSDRNSWSSSKGETTLWCLVLLWFQLVMQRFFSLLLAWYL